MEDHTARAGVGRCHDRGCRQRAALDVVCDLLERDKAHERVAQRRGVEQTGQVGAGQASEHRACAEQAPELGRGDQRPERVARAQLTPHLNAGSGCQLQRLVGASREERTVERPDAGTDDDVRRGAALGEGRGQGRQRSHLVGPAGPPPASTSAVR